MADLEIHKAWIVYPGESIIHLSEKIDAIPITMLNSISQ